MDAAVGRVITDRRIELGLTQQDVWTAIGMGKTPYRDIEQQRRTVPLEVLRVIAPILGMKVRDIVAQAEDLVDAEERRRVASNPHAEKLGRSLGFP
ncbi:helix-turn-helix domain-containing protein [Nocardia ignorata]|uniref:DNA-binding XRE family transcriptional regulator n=1 Tax=Nocardia ignorata TaxID=145285 RepID=A0A4V3CMK0_NOCIG|nr:helix-turn-helix transcriptional regulator [Nocardia ignorata]TDP29904.1 DNA-binding XRE family transcriptional regulator [Nocardia ignorata]